MGIICLSRFFSVYNSLVFTHAYSDTRMHAFFTGLPKVRYGCRLWLYFRTSVHKLRFGKPVLILQNRPLCFKPARFQMSSSVQCDVKAFWIASLCNPPEAQENLRNEDRNVGEKSKMGYRRLESTHFQWIKEYWSGNVCLLVTPRTG